MVCCVFHFLLIAADGTGIGLLSRFPAGRRLCHFSCIEGMCRITILFSVICDVAFTPLIGTLMPVRICIRAPCTAPYMVMFLLIIICIMEHDDIPVFQILFGHTQVRMDPVQRIHPAAVRSVIDFGKARSIRFCNAGNIIAFCIVPAVSVFCQDFLKHIQHRCIAADFILRIWNPGLKVACAETVVLFIRITVVLLITKKREIHMDIFRIFFQDLHCDLRICRAADDPYFLLPAAVFVVSLDLYIRQRNGLLASHIHADLDDHSGQVQVLARLILRPVGSGDLNRLLVWFYLVCCGELPSVSPERVIGTVITDLPAASGNRRAAGDILFRVHIDCTAGGLMLCAVRIHIPHKADALLCAASLFIIVVGDIIDPVQAGIITDDAANIGRFFSSRLHRSCKRIALQGINTVIPGLDDVSICTKDATDLVHTCDASCHRASFDCDPSSIRCGSIITVTSADDTACVLSGCLHCSVEFTADDRTLAHRIVTGATDTTNIIRAIDCRIAHTVLDRSLHAACD